MLSYCLCLFHRLRLCASFFCFVLFCFLLNSQILADKPETYVFRNVLYLLTRECKDDRLQNRSRHHTPAR